MSEPQAVRRARAAGIAVQAIVAGTLLFWAIMRLMSLAEEARVFRYEGF